MKDIINNFKLNNMQAYFVNSREDLYDLLDSLIPRNSTSGSGDSLTLEQLNIFEYLRNRTIFNDKHKSDLSKEEKRKIYLNNFDVDYFVTGTNAITKEGTIFNIDGNGSRVAPMLYGPKNVIVIVGKNKIVNNTEEAIVRSREIAAVLDNKRLKKNNPCVKLDRCVDCKSKNRICNDFVLIAHQFDEERIKVIIVDEDLGY